MAWEKINEEEQLMSLSASREVKIALLQNMCVLADCFGRESTHSFLLPYLISFMNDPAWEADSEERFKNSDSTKNVYEVMKHIYIHIYR